MSEATAEMVAFALLRNRMLALQRCRFPPASHLKSFVHSVCTRQPEQLTERQAAYVAIACWKLRRQLAPELVPASEPAPLPPKLAPPKPPAPMRAGRPRPKRRPDVRPDLLTR